MISRTGIHAIRALVQLARLPGGTFAGAAALARAIDAPQNYLGKLLQALSGRSLVESRKGLGGGFRLAKDPASITLYDVIDPIDSLDKWSGCLLGLPKCSDEAPCALHARWGGLRDQYLAMLRGTTVADIAAQE